MLQRAMYFTEVDLGKYFEIKNSLLKFSKTKNSRSLGTKKSFYISLN